MPDSGRSGRGPSGSQELTGRTVHILPVDVRHNDGMHLGRAGRGMAALGQLSLDGSKLGGLRDRDYLLTANGKH